MSRRIIAIVAATLSLLGVAAIPMAAQAQAEVTHVPSDPGPVGLLRVCVIVRAADSGLCVHV
jgi:ABC-type sugar transport system substrate-binding protein